MIMVKEPRPGRVKTRLAHGIGRTRAAWWFRHASQGLIRRSQSRRWQVWLAVSPDCEGLQSRIWPGHLRRIPQGRGDLGARMARVFRALPPGPAVIVGADIPGIDHARISRLFRALGDHDAALGPAADGGYWAIGLKRSRPAPMCFLQGVRWSTSHALCDTLASMNGLTYSLTDVLEDVDHHHDLARLSPRQRHSA